MCDKEIDRPCAWSFCFHLLAEIGNNITNEKKKKNHGSFSCGLFFQLRVTRRKFWTKHAKCQYRIGMVHHNRDNIVQYPGLAGPRPRITCVYTSNLISLS